MLSTEMPDAYKFDRESYFLPYLFAKSSEGPDLGFDYYYNFSVKSTE